MYRIAGLTLSLLFSFVAFANPPLLDPHGVRIIEDEDGGKQIAVFKSGHSWWVHKEQRFIQNLAIATALTLNTGVDIHRVGLVTSILDPNRLECVATGTWFVDSELRLQLSNKGFYPNDLLEHSSNTQTLLATSDSLYWHSISSANIVVLSQRKTGTPIHVPSINWLTASWYNSSVKDRAQHLAKIQGPHDAICCIRSYFHPRKIMSCFLVGPGVFDHPRGEAMAYFSPAKTRDLIAQSPEGARSITTALWKTLGFKADDSVPATQLTLVSGQTLLAPVQAFDEKILHGYMISSIADVLSNLTGEEPIYLPVSLAGEWLVIVLTLSPRGSQLTYLECSAKWVPDYDALLYVINDALPQEWRVRTHNVSLQNIRRESEKRVSAEVMTEHIGLALTSVGGGGNDNNAPNPLSSFCFRDFS
jgi:hypothetical protein